MLAIICDECAGASEAARALYLQCAVRVLDYLKLLTLDVSEIARVTRTVFRKRVLQGGTMQRAAHHAPHGAPLLMLCLASRTDPATSIEELRAQAVRVGKDVAEIQSSLLCSASANELDLPERWKHLLLAAFIAASNPAKSDARRIAASYQAATRKKKGGAFRAERAAASSSAEAPISGPRAFPLERLLSIYHSIFGQCDEEHELAASKGLLSEVRARRVLYRPHSTPY